MIKVRVYRLLISAASLAALATAAGAPRKFG